MTRSDPGGQLASMEPWASPVFASWSNTCGGFPDAKADAASFATPVSSLVNHRGPGKPDHFNADINNQSNARWPLAALNKIE